MRRLVALGSLVLILGSCYGPDASLTESGKSKPELELQFPSTTTAGATEIAELTITNPGPQEMNSLVVAFSRLGDPELPTAVVDVAPPNGEGAVREVTPKPKGTSPEGIIYTFGGLDEDDSVTISFTLVMPTENGPAGNAILVYDGQDPERARGVRLETEVGG